MSKQYLLMCSEEGKGRIEGVCNGTVEFLEVQGMNLNGESRYNLLVTPLQPVPCDVEEKAEVVQERDAS